MRVVRTPHGLHHYASGPELDGLLISDRTLSYDPDDLHPKRKVNHVVPPRNKRKKGKAQAVPTVLPPLAPARVVQAGKSVLNRTPKKGK